MKRKIIKVYISILRRYLLFFYDKKYLTGRMFSRESYTLGWRMAKKFCWNQKLRSINKKVPWPCNFQSNILYPENIEFDVDYIDNFFNFGCYYQAVGKIKIGKRTQIAPNVGIITSNHDLLDIDRHVEAKAVSIGDDCWIGMNAMILPGVTLGNHTVVGAGSVVTHSFPEGKCVIAGNPAKKIKDLRIEACGTDMK